MSLGQTMMVLGAMALLGIIVLTSNTAVLDTNQAQNESDAGLAAISLATSIMEEVQGKMFDETIADSAAATITSPTSLTSALALGKDGSERYRGGTNDFDDCDDFNQLKLLYRNSSDAGNVPSGAQEIIIPGLRARYYLRTYVNYVADTNLDQAVTTQTWHKRLKVVMTSPGNPALQDSLVFSIVMSYWN
jgi:hypothetical protein